MARRGLVFLCAASIAVTAAYADDPVVFRSGVALVRIDAQVVDRDNRVITGLGPRDFVLREQGRLQPVQSVDSEKLPIDLLLLLDVSASMRPHVQRVANASHEAFRQLRDQDRVAIMVFERSSRVRMGFRSSQSGVDRELENVLDYESFRGGTDITRGLLDAADMIRNEGRREARKAIVIVTDDQTELDRNVEEVERSLTRADAVLMALIAPDAMGTGRRGNPGGYPGGGAPGGPLGGIIFGSPRRYPGGGYPGGQAGHTQSAGTEEIARESGGDSMRVNDAYALQDTLARIRQSYAVYFPLPPGVRAGDEREIDLELADSTFRSYPGAQVRYRRNYYAPTSSNNAGVTETVPSAVSPDDPGPPHLQRRPVAGPGTVGSHDGPLDLGGGPSDQPQPAPSSSASPPPAPPAAQAQPNPNAPGWRKAKPDEVPH